jgi:uncharacterized protein (DUF486 family)
LLIASNIVIPFALCVKEPLSWNSASGFGFICLCAWFIFHGWT